MKYYHANFEVPADATPIFCQAIPLPLTTKSKVQAEVGKLEKGVIKTIGLHQLFRG